MNAQEFPKRRRQLMRLMEPDSIAILPAAPVRVRSRSVDYPYRQDSDFYYLSGFAEPEAVAVLMPGRAQGEYLMFCRERDPERETWEGRRVGPEGAVARHAADDAFPITDLDDILPGLLESHQRIYYTMGRNPEFDQKVIAWVKKLRSKPQSGRTDGPQEIIALEHYVHDLRLYKSRSEVSAMRRAAKIAVQAHKRAMHCCAPGRFEYELEAEFAHEFRRNGGQASYPAIVGGGVNGCILHYTENDQQLNTGDLVLIDAGCEYDYYASDVTRTFPVNGRFTEAQRALYDIVLEAQLAAIDEVRPGRGWNDPHHAAVRVITRGLVKLGILKGKPAKLIRDEAYRRFYMHKTGHWIGMDVHDVGDYRVGNEWRVLEPGMVTTVEPGIYIPPDSRGVAKKWRGIGIRIEDDVLVTRRGPDVLSKGLPKDPTEIETLMAQGQAGAVAGRRP